MINVSQHRQYIPEDNTNITTGELIERKIKEGALDNSTAGFYVNTTDPTSYAVLTQLACNKTGQVLSDSQQCGMFDEHVVFYDSLCFIY